MRMVVDMLMEMVVEMLMIELNHLLWGELSWVHKRGWNRQSPAKSWLTWWWWGYDGECVSQKSCFSRDLVVFLFLNTFRIRWPLILPTSGLPTGRQSWGRQFWVHQSSGLPTLIIKTYFDMLWTIHGKYNRFQCSSQSAILFPSCVSSVKSQVTSL